MKSTRLNAIITHKLNIAGLAVLIAFFPGCTTRLRNQQLETVAKDWALVIRASQVIPIYPLSEDLQPGDVLLVSTPIEEQVTLYKKKGFLPLDQHLVRLYSTEYRDFYNSRYGITDDTIPPAQWQQPVGEKNHNWQAAPRAAFPTYQFSVSTGKGLNLAIPIQGVPFALGLMNSGRASGTVTIADAYSYGLDNFRMEILVGDWGRQHRILLRNYEPQEGRFHFLRVVSRVYMTGSVNVTINNDESTSAEAAAGADRPVQLMGIEKGATKENFTSAIEAINVIAADQLPGAKVKIASASSRSVTLNETFERPLVIGYVGFDLPILAGGRLGGPISTLSQLTGRPSLPVSSPNGVYRLSAISHMFAALQEIQGGRAEAIRSDLDALDRVLPARYPFTLYELRSLPPRPEKDTDVVTGAIVERNGFQSVIDYIGLAQTTLKTLKDFQTNADFKTAYQEAQTAKEAINEHLNSEPALMEAIDYVFFDG